MSGRNESSEAENPEDPKAPASSHPLSVASTDGRILRRGEPHELPQRPHPPDTGLSLDRPPFQGSPLQLYVCL